MDTLEKLLLLEILVDNVYYEKTSLDRELMEKLKDTKVRFQFFDYPPIDIGEADFCQSGDKFDNSEVTFKSGKSILFALPDDSKTMRQPFDLFITISRKYASKKATLKIDTKNEDSEIEWKLYDIGKTVIHLGDSFLNLIEATSYDGICPASRTVRDTYSFSNDKGITVGYITVFVRLSCFGKIIVTQFQADTLEDKSFYFKGGQDEAAPATPPMIESGQRPQYGGREGPSMMMPPNLMPPNLMPPQSMMPPNLMPSQIPMPMYPQTMKIPVPLKSGQPITSKCGKVPSELLSTDSEGNKKGPYCLHRKCPQSYPRPPWVANGRKNLNGLRRSRKGTPVGYAAFQGDDVIFQMSDPNNPLTSVNKENTIFKVNHEPDQNLQNVQMVKPDYKPEIDDEHDVFLLKFGKRGYNDKPAKIIVTMKTPKVPPIKEHKCTSDQYCQSDASLLTIKKNEPHEPLPLSTTQIASALGKLPSNSSMERSYSSSKKGKKKIARKLKAKKPK